MAAVRRLAEAPSTITPADKNVVAHPAFREIPKCLFTLKTSEAQSEYDALARALFDKGKLTLGVHRSLSSYAMQFDTITAASAEGKQVRGSWFAQLDKARNELRLDDIDKPIAAPAGAPSNKFSRVGFASGRR